ncbi:hypothetical protein GUJ93_ZPchr0010g8356 [Zizania palustris]|uniref:Uncharacterized protein n=1 Tax=Zizania palustris TaxID=103762 RepID=A0A8J5WAY0_ZIZPA|nr:hypothetical protein GUJ93_ZPchr0010g8356 [Zizania palustris]
MSHQPPCQDRENHRGFKFHLRSDGDPHCPHAARRGAPRKKTARGAEPNQEHRKGHGADEFNNRVRIIAPKAMPFYLLARSLLQSSCSLSDLACSRARR